MSEDDFIEEIKEAIEGGDPHTQDNIDNRLTE